MVSPQARREQAAFLQERGLSARRACGLIGVARSSLSYRQVQPAKDAGDRIDEVVVVAVSAVRLSTNSDLSATSRPYPWRSSYLPALAASRPAAAQEAPETTTDGESCSSQRATGCQPRLGLRLRLRRLRQWTADQVLDRCRRIHPRSLGDRCRQDHPIRSRHRRLGQADHDPRSASLPEIRQRS